MKSMTISEGFRRAIGDRRVEHAFFSTYCFEPDFFELEILPLMLGTPALSSAESLRYHQLQALMGASSGRFGVAYDASVFAPTLAPRLEVDYLPVQLDNACHHAKLAVIEVANEDGSRAIILCAGSFNLTKAGWWENIEVGHWIELSETNAPGNILEPLRRALGYYLAQGELPVLKALRDRLAGWRPGDDHPHCRFYFSSAGKGSFTDFLKPVAHGKLEIISPYFAEDSHNTHVSEFLGRFDKVSMLLPRDARQAATITEAFYAGLREHAAWCDWHPSVEKEFALPAAKSEDERGYRKLHAKIYAGEDWQFVGSVNLSYKAMVANVEAGFLLTGTGRRKLLGKPAEAELFADSLALEAPAPETGALSFPAVFLTFDWHTGQLEASCQRHGTLVLYDKEGVEALRLPLEGQAAQLPAPGLREHLRRSSLVRASWHREGQSSTPRDILVSQRHVYCRPSALPPMSLQDLLRILQNMHPAHRAAAYSRLAAHAQRLNPDLESLEFLPPLPAASQDSTFFAEFSQVNAAFWQLKRRLAEHPAEIAYYLDGQQPDSLHGIVQSMRDAAPDSASTPVVRYLTLLSMDELLALHGRGGSALADSVSELIAREEGTPAFAAVPDKDKFLGWIKTMFSLPISSIPESHAEN